MAASRGHAACKAHQRPGKAGSAVARALIARFHALRAGASAIENWHERS
jgi:hypothetical protein